MNYLKISALLMLLCFISSSLKSQNLIPNDSYQEILNNIDDSVEILALGDPSHTEGTITTHRVNLIKELVDKKGYSIVAIESNLFELYKAYMKLLETGNVDFINNAMYGLFECKELNELFEFVIDEAKKGNTIKIMGFDPSNSSNSTALYQRKAIEKYLSHTEILSEKEKNIYLKNVKKIATTNITALFRNTPRVKATVSKYTEKILEKLNPETTDDHFFRQSLSNIISLIDNEIANSDTKRDMNMYNNILFLREMYPNEKMILFGSSTHFINRPKTIYSDYFQNNRITCGKQLKDNFKEKYYFLAYTSISGKITNTLYKSRIMPPAPNSIEKIIEEKTTKEVYYLNFESESDTFSTNIQSRLLGHYFQEMNVPQVCDGIVFMRNILPYTRK